jgi:hypothetical protein
LIEEGIVRVAAPTPEAILRALVSAEADFWRTAA